MAPLEVVLLLVAGVAAGAMNAVVGAGTLITFPTLLALGFPPVVANVSNTVGLVPGSVSAAYGFRAMLVGRWPLVARLAAASAIGGIIGGGLLLALPDGAFATVVPLLLMLAAVLAALQPRVAAAVARRREARAVTVPTLHGTRRGSTVVSVHPALVVAIAATGVYGGYFGAAQGVILLAVLGSFLQGGMTEVNGIKNVLAGTANLVSALLFIAIADVHWGVAGVVAVGATIGGGLGGRYGRRLPAGVLRPVVVVVAVVAAVWQWAR